MVSLFQRSRIYVETSALNFLAGKLVHGDAKATRIFHNRKGNKWLLSSSTIFEVLATGDDERKEKLIYLAQNLFSPELLPSLPELIVAYVNLGFPKTGKRLPRSSKESIADVWADLCRDNRRTFIYDRVDLRRRLEKIQRITKSLYRIIQGQPDVFDSAIALCLNRIPAAKESLARKGADALVWKASAFFVTTIFCSEIVLENDPIKKFWHKRGVSNIVDRMAYVSSVYPQIFGRGPFALMALMACVQARNKYSKGMLFDCLHTAYVPYVDWLLSSDRLFKELRNNPPVVYPPLIHILHTDEVQMTRHEVKF